MCVMCSRSTDASVRVCHTVFQKEERARNVLGDNGREGRGGQEAADRDMEKENQREYL